jgi:hypothetical protein
MGSRVNTSEKTAREYAAQKSVSVSKIIIRGAYKRIVVGTSIVDYNNRVDGGCACWHVNGVRTGYVGEAIKAAVETQA